MAVGFRRTTLSDVARRAGVSRMTLYRAFPDADALLAALMTREFGALIEQVAAEAQPGATARERLVEAISTGAQRMAENPLFARVLDVDPELLLPYVTDRIGQTQRAALGFYERLLAEGRDDGSIPRGDAAQVAYCLQIAAQGFVLSVRLAEAEGLRAQSFAELRTLIDAYLGTEGP